MQELLFKVVIYNANGIFTFTDKTITYAEMLVKEYITESYKIEIIKQA